MYHAYNVVHFLNGEGYQNSTIIEDIKRTFEDYRSGKGNDAIYKFISSFNNYLANKTQECLNFANIMMTDCYPNEYHQLLEYFYMPFKNSSNPMADKAILEEYFEIEDLRLDQAVMILIGDNYRFLYNDNQSFLDRINFFFNYEQISFEDIGTKARVGWFERMPSNPNEIILEFNETIQNPNDPNQTKKVGNYGELMFYNYLTSIANENMQVIWVSRDIGDGFGYDIAVYDQSINKITLYEVKTTTKEEYFNDTTLNEYESRICNLTKSYPDTDFHIIKILLGNQIKMIDINDKTETVSNIANPSEGYKVLKKSDKFINSYMAIKE